MKKKFAVEQRCSIQNANQVLNWRGRCDCSDRLGPLGCGPASWRPERQCYYGAKDIKRGLRRSDGSMNWVILSAATTYSTPFFICTTERVAFFWNVVRHRQLQTTSQGSISCTKAMILIWHTRAHSAARADETICP